MSAGKHSLQSNDTLQENSVQPMVKASTSAIRKGNKKGSGTPMGCLVVLGIALVALIIAAATFLINNAGPETTVNVGEEITIEVPEGASADSIAKSLVENHAIESSRDFLNAVKQQNAEQQLKPGTYRITGGTSNEEIVELLVSGKTGYSLTIPEGYTVKQIAKAVGKTCENVTYKEFYKLTQSASSYVSAYPFLEDAYNDSMEGFLFPATYSISYTADADEVLRQMLNHYGESIANVDMTYAKKKNLSAYDVLIIASMVEKEAKAGEYKNIAEVIYNRLHEKMSLGIDATTYYAVGKDLTEELTQEDLNSDSPYNTRNVNNKSLPPGPICCPGMESLQAAAKPSKKGYLYYFYSSSKGKTMFYKTSDEFNEALWQYGD